MLTCVGIYHCTETMCTKAKRLVTILISHEGTLIIIRVAITFVSLRST